MSKPAPNRVDISGRKYHRLTAIKFSGVLREKSLWLYRCDCGVEVVLTHNSVQTGNTKSCGCLKRDVSRNNSAKPHGQSSRNTVYKNYSRDAIRRGLQFSLTREQFFDLSQMNCYYCGAERSNFFMPHKNTNGGFSYNGIDRIDNKVGYINGNVVTCCISCNIAKHNRSQSDFINMCVSVAKRHGQAKTTS